MKNEFRAECLETVMPSIMTAFPNAEWVIASKKTVLAVDTGKIDESGRPVYATIEVTVKDNDGTKTREGFDIEAARSAFVEKQVNTATKTAKSRAKSSAKSSEAAAKREARIAKLREWWMNEVEDGYGYTSTDIKRECKIYAEFDVMRVGSDMKLLSEQLPTNCEMRVENGKRYYYKS